MITETRQSRTSLLHCYESHPRRRHHTLDNTTLDKFKFICVPLHLDKTRINSLSSSQSNLIITSSNQFSIPKLIGLASPTRRVRFKFDENQHTHSSDDVRLPKRYSIHRVEFQIPIYKDTNSYSNINCSSTPAKTRSITSQKIDINHNNTMHPQGIISSTDSSILSTVDSDKTKTEWYKDMYGRLHKSSETKKDVILVKLPPTPSRYREYYQQRDEQQNPYKPTYTFPEEFDGNLERMEDYMRKVASVDIDDDTKHSSSSTTNVKDHQTISKRTHFDDRLSSPITPSSTERTKSNNDASASARTINPKSNPTHIRTPSSTTDDEQKLIYKRILRGGEIPSTGLQKFSVNNREKSNDHDQFESDQQKSQSRSNDFQPIYKAFALHNFYAQTNKELPFKKGDTILVKRRINDDWLEGAYQGKTGIFPVNHVELFPYEIMEGEAIVKYDFLPENQFELQLKKNEKVILLRKLDNNWYEGRLNHLEGIFPADYVEILREPKDNSLKQSNQNEHTTNITKMPKSLLKNSTDLQQTAIEKINIVPESSLPRQKCQVLYDYTPQNPDELEIHVGDIINIIEMCDDGWYCGVMEKSNHENKTTFGTFPGNYVKILPI